MKKAIKYETKNNGLIKKEDAQKIGNELDRIKKKYGVLQPRLILKEAEHPLNILHNYFIWDNTIAAEKFRLQQARGIVEVIIEVRIIEKKSCYIRSFHSVNDKKYGNIYVSLEQVTKNSNYRKQLLDRANAYLGNLMNTLRLLRDYI